MKLIVACCLLVFVAAEEKVAEQSVQPAQFGTVLYFLVYIYHKYYLRGNMADHIPHWILQNLSTKRHKLPRLAIGNNCHKRLRNAEIALR